MEPREYQKEAVQAVYDYLRKVDGKNPCVVIPTGGGKSLVMAMICRDIVQEWKDRVLILAHVKELLEQNANHLREIMPDIAALIGVHSASLKRHDTAHPIIVAGIQSVYKKALKMGRFDVIIIDEAHMIPEEGQGRYRTFLQEAKLVNPEVRVIGFTATPYRLTTGYICKKDGILNDICYEIGVKKLIEDGFLSPLVSHGSHHQANMDSVKIKGGEYDSEQAEQAMLAVVQAATEEILQRTQDRKSVIIFCSGVKHAEAVAKIISENGHECATIFGDTKSTERDAVVKKFKSGAIKYLVNVNVLTIGFDHRGIDCVALMRATLSPGLYYQMVGRGLRKEDGKTDCLVLDYGGNVLRHGPIDRIRVKDKKEKGSGEGEAPMKKCPKCLCHCHASAVICSNLNCDYVFPKKAPHKPTAGTESIVSATSVKVLEVAQVFYSRHQNRNDASKPDTMRVEYITNLYESGISEWVCFGHHGVAREKAIAWWKARSYAPCPDTIDEALWLIKEEKVLANTEAISVKYDSSKKFPEIISFKLSARPEIGRTDKKQHVLAKGYFKLQEVIDMPVNSSRKLLTAAEMTDEDIPF